MLNFLTIVALRSTVTVSGRPDNSPALGASCALNSSSVNTSLAIKSFTLATVVARVLTIILQVRFSFRVIRRPLSLPSIKVSPSCRQSSCILSTADFIFRGFLCYPLVNWALIFSMKLRDHSADLDADPRPGCSGSRRTGKFARCAIISRYEQSLLYNDERGSNLTLLLSISMTRILSPVCRSKATLWRATRYNRGSRGGVTSRVLSGTNVLANCGTNR